MTADSATPLLLENEIDSQNQETKPDDVVETECLGFENRDGENREDCQRHNFLNYF